LGIWPGFDLLQPEAARFIVEARPDVVIHAAAYTNVERAESEPELAMAVNAEGTERVARACAEVRARLVYVSTDYVFDGRKATPYLEQDEPNPLGVYARSKREGEKRAQAHCPKGLIVRTSWLYGLEGRNFVKTIIQLAVEQSELRVVADQYGSPTYAKDLAGALNQMLNYGLTGIVHATGSGECTWHEFACEILSLMEFRVPVRPISTEEAKQAAPRPRYSVLNNSVLAQTGMALPHWKDALARYLKDVHAKTQLLSTAEKKS